MWNLYQEDSTIGDDLNLVFGATVEVITCWVLLELLHGVERFPGRVSNWVATAAYHFLGAFFCARLVLIAYQWRRLWRLAGNVNRQHFTETPIEALQAKMAEIGRIEARQRYAQRQAKMKMKPKFVKKLNIAPVRP